MKKYYVSKLKPNELITDFFLVQSKEVRTKRQSSERYLSLRLTDRSGQIEAKMWDGVEKVVHSFEQDDCVKVQGVVETYRDRPQLIVQKLRAAEEDEVDLADLMPHTERDIDEMFAEVEAVIDGFENAHLKRLMQAFFNDPEIARRFKKAPAAKAIHHGFIGGLIEHVVNLLRLSKMLAENYDLDRDLLQTGVLLHDLGKIYELGYERAFYYTDDGQLLGHISMVVAMVDRKCEELGGFPPKLKILVQHMLLSHHGRLEFGSPKQPMFPEALALHYLDDLDSKLECMRASIAETPEAAWSSFNSALGRAVLNKEAYLAEEPEPPEPSPPPLAQGSFLEEMTPRERPAAEQPDPSPPNPLRRRPLRGRFWRK